jgi:hypothetical protein
VAANIQQAAEALLARYPSAPAAQTEATLAVVALWALDAIEVGRLDPAEADRVFTMLDVEIDETPDGPALSDNAHQLVLEGMMLHDWGTEFSADPVRMRDLAFAILRTAA